MRAALSAVYSTMHACHWTESVVSCSDLLGTATEGELSDGKVRSQLWPSIGEGTSYVWTYKWLSSCGKFGNGIGSSVVACAPLAALRWTQPGQNLERIPNKSWAAPPPDVFMQPQGRLKSCLLG